MLKCLQLYPLQKFLTSLVSKLGVRRVLFNQVSCYQSKKPNTSSFQCSEKKHTFHFPCSITLWVNTRALNPPWISSDQWYFIILSGCWRLLTGCLILSASSTLCPKLELRFGGSDAESLRLFFIGFISFGRNAVGASLGFSDTNLWGGDNPNLRPVSRGLLRSAASGWKYQWFNVFCAHTGTVSVSFHDSGYWFRELFQR